MKLEELKEQLPFKWRVQSVKYGKAICVAYIDARDAQDLLDEVVGPGNWQSIFYEEGGLLFCKVGINTSEGNGTHNWVWKSDTGSESNVEKEKGHVSDAFKRACVSWGIGRFLYRLPIQTLATEKYKGGKEYPYSTEHKKILFSGEDLTKYINWRLNKEATAKQTK